MFLESGWKLSNEKEDLELIIQNEENITQCDILIVDDDYAISTILSEFFNLKGLKSEKVLNGKQALKILEVIKPRVILLDIVLPDIDGYTVCKTIRLNKNLKDILIYYITALSRENVEENIKISGADGYILKPFNFSRFKIIIDFLKK